jgi:S-adenosylmethionine hydrolase
MTVISLTTDFGMKDGNVGVMKGVILGIAPQAQIVDISHFIGAQNIREAGLILVRSAPYFPAGTIHVVVVAPGVGTSRHPLVVSIGSYYYVGPDNGVITPLVEYGERQGWVARYVRLSKPAFWLPRVSNVFHGRDIFAPVAAHLAVGTSIWELGEEIDQIERVSLPQPRKSPGGWIGEVIHVDHFGNIATNIREEHLGKPDKVITRLRGIDIEGMVNTFGERPVGELVVLFGSTGNLIICEVNGNAASRLGVKVGERVEVTV